MIGPRDSVVRIMLGEDVPLDDMLTDQSEFVDSDMWLHMPWHEGPPEFWIDKIHDFVVV